MEIRLTFNDVPLGQLRILRRCVMDSLVEDDSLTDLQRCYLEDFLLSTDSLVNDCFVAKRQPTVVSCGKKN